MVGNQLAFRTSINGKTILPNVSTSLTQGLGNGVSIIPYENIRVILTNRINSVSQVTFFLSLTQDCEWAANLQSVTLQPGETFTNTYKVPGRWLNIEAVSGAGSGSNTVDALVYGFIPYMFIQKEADFNWFS